MLKGVTNHGTLSTKIQCKKMSGLSALYRALNKIWALKTTEKLDTLLCPNKIWVLKSVEIFGTLLGYAQIKFGC